MALNFTQTDTAADCGSIAACSGATVAGTTKNALASVGGTAGSTAADIGTANESTQAGAFFELAPGSDVTWDAGTWTVRLNVTSANSAYTITAVYICRLNSSCVSQATIGSSTGLSISCGSTGVKSINVTGAEQASAATTDKAYVVVVFENTNVHGSATIQITPDQDIDTPLTSTGGGGGGDFPVPAERNNGGNSSDTTDHTITLPSTKSGKLIVVLSTNGPPSSYTWPSGWTELVRDDSGTNGLSIGYRDLDGTEGASITVTTPEAFRNAWTWERVTGAASGAPSFASADSAGVAGAADPPSLSPAGGSKKYLWIAAAGLDQSSTNTVTGAPTDFTNFIKFDKDDAGGFAVPPAAHASRQLEASSLDPGAFSQGSTDDWIAATLALAAPDAGGGAAPPTRALMGVGT